MVNGEEPVRSCDTIKITGKPENCEAAKEALLNLVPVTIEVNVRNLEISSGKPFFLLMIVFSTVRLPCLLTSTATSSERRAEPCDS